MTVRTVFEPNEKKPFYKKVRVEFDFHPGLSPLQKKKNVKAMHEAYNRLHPEKKVLEVSTKGEDGQPLSPFNLKKWLPHLEKAFPVENIYHASKVKENRGPFYDLLGTTPLEAKQDPRANFVPDKYELEGETYPARPDLLFFNWIYAMAVLENNLANLVMEPDAFTDVEFSGEDGNCQARACAITQSLLKQGKLKKGMTFQEFADLFLSDASQIEIPETKPIYKEDKPKTKRTVFSVGDVLEHPTIGQGQVVKKTGRDYTILFRVAGPKTLRKEIVETRCRKI